MNEAGGWEPPVFSLRLGGVLLGPYLREWRAAQGASLQEAAIACGVSLQILQRWEDNPESFPLTHARKLADAWHWPSVDRFFTLPASRQVNDTQRLVHGWATHMSGHISSVYLQYLHEYMVPSDRGPALSVDQILWAMAESARRGRRHWRYLDGILSRLVSERQNGGDANVFPDRNSNEHDPFQLARQLANH